jgi:hypothetical protein
LEFDIGDGVKLCEYSKSHRWVIWYVNYTVLNKKQTYRDQVEWGLSGVRCGTKQWLQMKKRYILRDWLN